MNSKFKLLVALSALTFLYVEAAQAGLVRNTGRSTLSRVYSTEIFHIENQYLNAGGIITDIMGPGPRPESEFIRSSASINGDSNPIGAFPAGVAPGGGGSCYRGYETRERDDLRDAIDNGTASQGDIDRLALIELQDPCEWEFEQGEQISTFGFFGVAMFENSLVLDSLVDYDVDWVIDNQVYDGEINRGAAIVTPDGTIARGGVFLNADINLAPGEYDIFVRVTLSSDSGQFFAYSPNDPDDSIGFSGFNSLNCVDNPNFVDPVDYEDANNGSLDGYVGDITIPEFCGHQNVLLDRGDEPFVFDQTPSFRSETELLRILSSPVNPDPDATVSAPASMSLLLIGMAAFRSNRKRAKARLIQTP